MLLEELFTDVADSIRGWKTTENKISAQNFADEIEKLPVLETEDATATADVILEGATAYIDGEKVIGTMPDNDTLNYYPNDYAQTIPLGYTDGGVVNPADITILKEYKECLALANSIDTPIDYDVLDTTANDIRTGKIVYINGEKVIGTMEEGVDTSDATATAEDIVEGETAYANGVKLVGTFKGLDTSDATAISSNILSGETAYVNGTKVEGTMTNNGTLTYSPGDEEIIIPEGYTSGGKVEAADITTLDEYEACLTLANSIENLEDYNNTTATAEDILEGKTAYSNGEKLVGTYKTKVTVEKTIPVQSDPGTVQIKLSGKNKFDQDDWYNKLRAVSTTGMSKITVDSIQYFRINPAYISTYQYMKGMFKENTQYTISWKGRAESFIDGGITGFKFRYTDGTTSYKNMDHTLIDTEYVLISDKDKTIDCIDMTWGYGEYAYVRDIQLEEGIIVTEYTKHVDGDTYTFDLSKGDSFEISLIQEEV